MTKTITGLFDNYTDATNAVRDLESIGISHSDISIVAHDRDHTQTRSGDARVIISFTGSTPMATSVAVRRPERPSVVSGAC